MVVVMALAQARIGHSLQAVHCRPSSLIFARGLRLAAGFLKEHLRPDGEHRASLQTAASNMYRQARPLRPVLEYRTPGRRVYSPVARVLAPTFGPHNALQHLMTVHQGGRLAWRLTAPSGGSGSG
jgi:hypothetical protein